MAKSDNPELTVARELLSKGITLRKENKLKEAIATFDEILVQFEQSFNPELQEFVDKALCHRRNDSRL